MSKLKDTLSQRWFTIQTSLFPWLSEELGELTDKQQELVTTLEMIRIEEFILSSSGYPGRQYCRLKLKNSNFSLFTGSGLKYLSH